MVAGHGRGTEHEMWGAMLPRSASRWLALPLLGLFGALAAPSCAATTALPSDDDGPEPTGERNDPVFSGNVYEAMKQTCSTSSIKPLSQQIIDEARCLEPEAFVSADDLPSNVKLGDNVFAYLDADARAALEKAALALPSKTLTVASMYRTVAQQYMVYRWYQEGRCGIGLAAKPGASNHETGLALDVSETSTWRTQLTSRGFSWLGSKDPPHYDYTGPGATNHKGLDVLAFQRLWNRNNPGDLIAEDAAYGPQTEARLKKAPAGGFAKGALCTGQSGGEPPESTCAHDPCEEGGKLDAGCDGCVATICGGDQYCCDTAWDDVCVGQVASVCGASCDAPAGCGPFEGKTELTCGPDGNGRGKCVGGELEYEACAKGCLIQSGEDVCMTSASNWSCTGSYGTKKVTDGDYYATNFGCYTEGGVEHDDPYDNCIPACLSKAQQSGLCAGLSGPDCEKSVNWYAADAARFGCMARLRVENPKNGKKVVVVALDYGPACWVEKNAGGAVVDLSVPAVKYLFGEEKGWADKAEVHVVEVDAATPLGPVD